MPERKDLEHTCRARDARVAGVKDLGAKVTRDEIPGDPSHEFDPRVGWQTRNATKQERHRR